MMRFMLVGYSVTPRVHPRNLAKFNGTEWVNVDKGIQQGGAAWVATMQSHKGELYIVRKFLKN